MQFATGCELTCQCGRLVTAEDQYRLVEAVSVHITADHRQTTVGDERSMGLSAPRLRDSTHGS